METAAAAAAGGVEWGGRRRTQRERKRRLEVEPAPSRRRLKGKASPTGR